MKKKTILITGLLTIGIMSLIGIGCSKKDVTKTESEQGVTYESQKARIAGLEKKIGKTRGLEVSSNSWTSSSTIPVPVISKFMYCGSSSSPLGSNFVRFKYQVNIAPNNNYYSNNKVMEFKIYSNNWLPEEGYKIRVPLTLGNGKPIIGLFPKCLFIDVPTGGQITTIPWIMTASLISNGATSSNYEVNGISGFINGSGVLPTLSVSQAWILDPLVGTNPCP